ncbi:MAG: thioredoxin family protein [Candidatus Bilamarchaeaceae archaeon]
MKNEETKNILIAGAMMLTCGMVLFALMAFYLVTSVSAKPDLSEDAIEGGEKSVYDNFAKCLTEKGAIMYGADWCPHCQNQKRIFGDSFRYINYINCEKNYTTCVSAKIEGIPTWIIDGRRYTGEQSLQALANITGCNLNTSSK